MPNRGALLALGAAVLFGATTPIAKQLLGPLEPLLLAGLFYLGSGIGLAVWLLAKSRDLQAETPLRRKDVPWLVAAILSGGVVAPVLLMVGLLSTNASTASLLLNLEGVLTATLAWLVFKENYDARMRMGMLAITAGGIVLVASGDGTSLNIGAMLIVAACMCWSVDNNLTRKISMANPAQIACLKGLVAGVVNVGLGLAVSKTIPASWPILVAAVVGFLGYGVSLVLFVLSLRTIGTARTSAYFAVAPFVGATLSIVLLSEQFTARFALAALLMCAGLWLHLTERHDHEHVHESLEHEHTHSHDEHHQHEHSPEDPSGEPHSHSHQHAPIRHKHPHYPDNHHHHDH